MSQHPILSLHELKLMVLHDKPSLQGCSIPQMCSVGSEPESSAAASPNCCYSSMEENAVAAVAVAADSKEEVHADAVGSAGAVGSAAAAAAAAPAAAARDAAARDVAADAAARKRRDLHPCTSFVAAAVATVVAASMKLVFLPRTPAVGMAAQCVLQLVFVPQMFRCRAD